MKRHYLIPALLLTLPLAGCDGPPFSEGSRVEKDYAAESKDCDGVAQSRLGLYVRPDPYPMSDKEKTDAYYSLFDECMHERGWDIAQGKEAAPTPAPKDTADLGSLSPSAGKPDSANTVAPGVTVINPQPADGKQGAATNPTVVVVQSPPQSASSSSPFSFFFNNNAPAEEKEAEPAPAAMPAPAEPAPFVMRVPPSPADAPAPPASPAPPAPQALLAAPTPALPLTPAPRPPAANPDTVQLEQILTNTQ